MKVTVTNVDSSTIKSFVYDRDIPFDSGELSITFKNDHTYYYENVSMFDVIQLISETNSVGSKFNAVIKNRYQHYDKSIPILEDNNESKR